MIFSAEVKQNKTKLYSEHMNKDPDSIFDVWSIDNFKPHPRSLLTCIPGRLIWKPRAFFSGAKREIQAVEALVAAWEFSS